MGDTGSDGMRVAFVSSLLGILAHVVGTAASDEDIKVSVSVWPPGSNIFVGERVFLQCTVESNASLVWSYQWFQQRPRPGPTPRPRHLIAGDSYVIAAVTREDAGGYGCQAERKLSNTSSVVLLSQPTTFSVSEQPVSSLALTPDSRQVHTGQRFTLRCPQTWANSSGWMLRHFSPGRRVRKRILHTGWCSPVGGAVGAGVSNTCAFTATSENTGLYWCEGAEGRTNSIYITVSSGLILRTPGVPVSEGDTVVLQCQYLTASHSETIFLKNEEVLTFNYSSHAQVVKMTLENVTQEDEGYYKCASQDRKMESPESWLSVRPQEGNFTSADWSAVPAGGSQTWITVSCALVLLVLTLMTVCLVYYYRAQIFSAHRCWPSSQQEPAAVGFPATKQDATEVQWDLSWMEMSNLLDKQLYPGT